MIPIKNTEQLKLMRQACRITGEALLVAEEAIRPGISTKALDSVIRAYIEKCNARPTFLGYGGFPAAACISINDEVIHGIPSDDRFLSEGDIVKIDVGAHYRGFTGDAARTFAVGRISQEAAALIRATEESFRRGAAAAVVGNRIGDIGSAVETYVREFGYSVVRKFVGHGVGAELHEEPEVPNFGTPGRGVRLFAGMTLAIEPMVNVGGADVRILPNRWTVVTVDGLLSAHYENTVAVTADGPELMTDIK
ncbi:MAG: type I methionyl aminopeptidase [Clostridia bacterium]|nr:type I methionyl aminopeptidase [Clostridia bacterium]